MGHARADAFRRHYMHPTVKVDTQSDYLGTTKRGDLIKTVGLMSNKRDPRAPVKLGAGNMKKLPIGKSRIDPPYRQTESPGGHLKGRMRAAREARTLKPEEHQEYTRLTGRIQCIRKELRRTALKVSRAKWFESADHDEIVR